MAMKSNHSTPSQSNNDANLAIQQPQINVPRSGLPAFPQFDPNRDNSTLDIRWKKWQRRFNNLLISLRKTDPTIQRALFQTYVGEPTNDIFDTLPNTGADYNTAVQSLSDHFVPPENEDMAIFDFRQIKQQKGEPSNEFYRRFKEEAALCSYGDEDKEIKTFPDSC